MTEIIARRTVDGLHTQNKLETLTEQAKSSKELTNFLVVDGGLTSSLSSAGIFITAATTPTKKLSTLDKPHSSFTGGQCHPQLLRILRTKRAHNSVGDYNFRAELLAHLAPLNPWIEGAGNIVVKLGDNRIAFSCHVDTCHSVRESDGSFQDVVEDMGLLKLGSDSRCLGADDGIGIFFMLQLLESGVPGTYIFHTAEECGAEGSLSINEECRAFTKTFDLIVAFDRAVMPGQSPEVIITQGGTKCASEECGQALADALNAVEPSLGYEVSHRGVFTDTLNYAGNVNQCLNVGCFYADQHTSGEFVDVEKVNTLLRAILAVRWDDLPVQRSAEMFGFKDTLGRSDYFYAALTSAFDGDYSSLVEAMAELAEEIYMLDTREARSYIKVRALTNEVLERALTEYEDGCPADDVLLFLYDETTR